jgi:uncharacterized membrane protein
MSATSALKEPLLTHDHAEDMLYGIFLVAIVLAAMWLRWRDLGSQSLWEDEGYTLWISRFSPQEIWHMLRMDATTPLHYVLIHYWSNCLGTSEFSLRALSAVFGTLSIPLYFLLARKVLIDRMAVTFAMALYAVAFFQVWHARNARFYALLIFLSLGSVYCLLLYLENRGLVPLCGVVLSLALSLYTHNMALFYLPGFAVLWLVYPSERTLLARVKDGLLAGSVVLLLYLPWLPTLAAQVQRIHRGWINATPGVRDLLDSLCILSGFDTRTLQTVFRDQLRIHISRVFGFWTWAALLLVVVVACILGGLFAARIEDRRKTAALAVYALSPVLLTFALSRVSNSVFETRVFLGCCSVLPMVLAAPIAFQVGNRRKAFLRVGLVVLVLAVVSAAGYLRREKNADWRGATKYLVQLPERDRLLVIVPDIGLPLVHYYAAGLSKSGPPIELTGLLTRFDPTDVDLEKRMMDLVFDPHTDDLALLAHEMASERYKEVDVVMSYGWFPSRVKPVLWEYLAAHCTSTEAVEFHSLEVRRCSVRSTGAN